MARHKKNTVDYFPHPVNDGTRMFIMEQKYGDKGYCCYYKILQFLGRSDNHFIDFRVPKNRAYLCAFVKCSELEFIEMIDTLVELESLDKELWEEKRIIWSNDFVESIKVVYINRSKGKQLKQVEIPKKPGLDLITTDKNTPTTNISTDKNTQSIVEYSIVENSKVNYLRFREKIIYQDISVFFKLNFEAFLETWQMQNKNFPAEKVLKQMELDYICYTFNNENHLKNSFKSTFEKLQKHQKEKSYTNTGKNYYDGLPNSK